VATGTRVARNSQAPLYRSGFCSTASHEAQSIMQSKYASSGFSRYNDDAGYVADHREIEKLANTKCFPRRRSSILLDLRRSMSPQGRSSISRATYPTASTLSSVANESSKARAERATENRLSAAAFVLPLASGREPDARFLTR